MEPSTNGKKNIAIDRTIHKRLKIRASREGRPLGDLIREALLAFLRAGEEAKAAH